MTDDGMSWAELWHIVMLRDYNTRIVVIGTSLLGLAAGVIGTFAYLRKRALMGDALSHATLPGIAIAFLLTGAKSTPVLLCGAVMSGILGVVTVLGLRQYTRLKEDAAIGIVLSVFFGIGVVLLSVIQQMNTGNQAGINTFIYGKAAAMLQRDATMIAATAALVITSALMLFKEFRLVCFDQAFAASRGYPVMLIDTVMMGLVVATTVIGLQAVGLILIIAMLIIPPAAARFWTERLPVMLVLSGLLGGLAGWLGSSISASAPHLPTGAIIVLCAGAMFTISMLCAPQRGLVASIVRRWTLRRRVAYQHLLRAMAEFEERRGLSAAITLEDLRTKRSWTRGEVEQLARRAIRRGTLERHADALHLTADGRVHARRMLRNHRLWEMYLIHYADIAPSHVDRDADEVEHVLPEGIIAELQAALQAETIPPSPHREDPVS